MSSDSEWNSEDDNSDEDPNAPPVPRLVSDAPAANGSKVAGKPAVAPTTPTAAAAAVVLPSGPQILIALPCMLSLFDDPTR